MRITLKQLRAAGACADQRELFKEKFGDYVDVTAALCLEHAEDFDWDWAADNLLPRPARRAFNKAEDAAWRVFEEAQADLLRAYQKVVDQMWSGFDKPLGEVILTAKEVEALADAQRAYMEATAPYRRAYNEATARAFAQAAELVDQNPSWSKDDNRSAE